MDRMECRRETLPKCLRPWLGLGLCPSDADHETGARGHLTDALDGAIDPDQLVRYFEGQRPDLPEGARLSIICEHPDGGVLPPDVLREGFIADASDGKAFVAPLLELESMDAVRRRLWNPAFASLADQK
jgi:hypothetical protein